MTLLDTHIWIWWLLGDPNLTNKERLALNDLSKRKQLFLSIFSVWEFELLERKKRITLRIPFKDWVHTATSQDIITLVPVDVEIICALRYLPASLPNDPGDRIIIGTASVRGFQLATHDQKIIASNAVSIWKAE